VGEQDTVVERDETHQLSANPAAQSQRALTPLAYHSKLVAWLQKNEATVWAWGTSQKTRDEQLAEMRESMLRHTYRLEADSHADVHAACRKAMTALEIDAPVTLYQAGGNMNAALCFIPGEIHLVFQGPVIERLSSQELVALMGHELAHYKLWSLEDGAYHAASMILDHALAYSDTAASHTESDRLFSLHTELYADRGGALAAGDSAPAITLLLKTMTGIPNPDATAYLRQAAELEKNATPSQGISHPEVFLRAQAVDKWWRGEAGTEAWIAERLSGPLSFGKLDLLRQVELTELTGKYFRFLISDPAMRTSAVMTEIQHVFPDWQTEGEALTSQDMQDLTLDDSVRDYFAALTFDLAMADADVREDILSAGAQAATHCKFLDGYKNALRRDLKLTRAVIDRITAHAARGAAA
jgi:hypothetical protein